MTTEEKIEVFTVGRSCKIKWIDGESSRYQNFKLEWTKKGATLSDEKKWLRQEMIVILWFYVVFVYWGFSYVYTWI